MFGTSSSMSSSSDSQRGGIDNDEEYGIPHMNAGHLPSLSLHFLHFFGTLLSVCFMSFIVMLQNAVAKSKLCRCLLSVALLCLLMVPCPLFVCMSLQGFLASSSSVVWLVIPWTGAWFIAVSCWDAMSDGCL